MEPCEIIRLSKSIVGSREQEAVANVLQAGYLGMGETVLAFEKSLEKFLGRPVVCVSSGTAALQLALQAAEIGHGDEVLVQSMTYCASFQAISATGARPVACDINTDNISISLNDAKQRITKKLLFTVLLRLK